MTYLGYIYGPQPGNENENITLPPDMIKPLELWECISGQEHWVPMKQAADSIASRPTTSRFRIWDFQNDKLILPGASEMNDLKIKYLCVSGSYECEFHVTSCVHRRFLRASSLPKSPDAGRPRVAQVFDGAEKAKARINRTARKESYGSFNRHPFRGRRGREEEEHEEIPVRSVLSALLCRRARARRRFANGKTR